MLNMSFMLTTAQMYARTKTVTRRLGWDDLKPGDRVMACEKCQGLGKGGTVTRIVVIEIVSNSKSVLCWISKEDVVKEGFPGMRPAQFVRMFVAANKCAPDEVVNRIEFKYVEVQHG